MPRRKRPTTTTRSEHWLRLLINKRPDLIDSELNRVFRWGSDAVHWVSPLAADSYAEYYDESFLDVLGVTPAQVPLKDFWPRSGPRWDGLGKTLNGRVILVEAKAYIEEAADGGTKAGPNSKYMILAALEKTRKYLNVKPNAIWEGAFYQYANRLARLYYLSVLNRIDAYLVFVYFLNADDVPSPCVQEQWDGAIRVIKAALGLRQHRLASRAAGVFIDTGSLKD
jgi:hypothetical protein